MVSPDSSGWVNRLQHVCSLIKVSAGSRVVTPDVSSPPEAKELNFVKCCKKLGQKVLVSDYEVHVSGWL